MLPALLLFAACDDDFLNAPPVDQLGSESFYASPTQCEQGVVGVYADLRQIPDIEYNYLSECKSDNTYASPTPNGYRAFSEMGNFRASESEETFNTIWNYWYKVIYDANVALSKIPDCDFELQENFKSQLLGEVHFLRGWAYFELVRLFGNVPIVEKPISPSEAANVAQSPAKEVYEKIVVPDLKSAKELLPPDAEMTDANRSSIAGRGRADKIAAQAMLGRVYMTMWGFPLNDASAQALAEAELKGVIDFSKANGNKYWAPDSTEWRRQWISEYNNRYSIFAIQYRSGGYGNPAIFNYSPELPDNYTTIRIFGNEIYVEKTLLYEFDRIYTDGGVSRKDSRGYGHTVLAGFDAYLDVTAYPVITDTLEADGATHSVQLNAIPYKYMNSLPKRSELGFSANIETAMADYNDWPVNFPVIRYEDVLLMYAEVLAAKGDADGAMAIVNDIRTRAGCTAETATAAADALKLVKRERRVELALEGVRWFDLVRWNEWKSAVVNMFNRYGNPTGTDVSNVKDGRHLCPIPSGQMSVKPGFYTQNAGYGL